MVRFQQLSAPTAAKSVEDTAFYRYGRLIGRNEVGSEPSQWALLPSAFHALNVQRQRRFPRALLATATHDHKRGEDTRMRLATLSGRAAEWEAAIGRWTRLNAASKRDLDGPAPDATDELMLYQTLVGAWPSGLGPDDSGALEAFRDRVGAWLQKAQRESKRRSTWAAPDEPYEAASQAFLAACLDPARPVVAEIAAFAERLAPAAAISGLGQALLRTTCPGVPDLYQGTEYWDFSLVDPDNRRPVDYERRAATLDGTDPADLLPHWQDGRVKQAVIARALGFRARHPELFASGKYQPLKVEGPAAEHILAFARVHEGRAAVVVVTRGAHALPLGEGQAQVNDMAWQGTAVLVPRPMHGQKASCVLGGWSGPLAARLQVGSVLARLPVALLEVAPLEVR